MTASRPTLTERYRGQTIFLTGASGFLGRAVLEKMLRALPEVEQVILLLRPQADLSTRERVDAIMGSPLFRRLRHERDGFADWWPRKIQIVDGALDQERFGLEPQAWSELAARVTSVIHVGALTAFRRPLDSALETNTLGAGQALALARDAGNVPMVYVSTAYVCGRKEGAHAEAPIPWGHTPRTLQAGSPASLDPREEVRRLLERCRDVRTQTAQGVFDGELGLSSEPTGHAESTDHIRAKHADRQTAVLGRVVAHGHGWPDPYPMSKALAEQLLVHDRADVPLAIVRPSIVSSTLAEPEPGWLVGVRMADPIIAAAGVGALDLFPGHPESVLDLIPCDLAVNAVLAALPERGVDAETWVYHVGTSSSNPLTLAAFRDAAYEAAMGGIRFQDQKGRVYKPSHLQIRSPARVRLAWTVQRKRLKVLARVLSRVGLKSLSRRVRTKVSLLGHARVLAKAYAPYSVRQFRFLTENLTRLEAELCAADRARFPMNPQDVDWPRYIGQVHLRAVRREAGYEPASEAAGELSQSAPEEAGGA